MTRHRYDPEGMAVVATSELLYELRARHYGHRDVEEYEVRSHGVDQIDPGDPVLRFVHGVPVRLEDEAHCRAQLRVVVDDNDRLHARATRRFWTEHKEEVAVTLQSARSRKKGRYH